MSVLPCSRSGCGNIMCDRYSPKHGYICDECLNELIECVGISIEDFLDLPVGERNQSHVATEWETKVLTEFPKTGESTWD